MGYTMNGFGGFGNSPNKSAKDWAKNALKVAKPFLKGAAKRVAGPISLVLGSTSTSSTDQPGTGGHGGRKIGSIRDMI
tara:strand:- start:1434 stop:1667 length:234 start_codon:yes stop_codon:yes gene_type:complete